MLHEEYRDMLTARALLSLDASDEAVLSEHLTVCAACRNELKEWEETSALITYTTAPMEPSSDLRERILKEIRANRQVSDQPQTDRASQTVLPFAKPQRNVWTNFGSLGAIAAAILFVGLLVFVVFLWRENQAAKRELAQLERQRAIAQYQLARERELYSMLTAPGSRISELVGTKAAPTAHARLAFDKAGHAVLLTSGLPAAPAGKGYQLWFIVGAQPLPGRVFNTDDAGNGTLRDQLPTNAIDKAVFAVTMESSEGAQTPTSAILLMSQ